MWPPSADINTTTLQWKSICFLLRLSVKFKNFGKKQTHSFFLNIIGFKYIMK